ncbi:hypothetical protein OAJ27_01935 [bacterium]|nr:hypothetical protein [bacterium]
MLKTIVNVLIILILYAGASTSYALYKDDYFDKKVLYDNSKLLQLREYEIIRLRRAVRDEEIRKNKISYSDSYYTKPSLPKKKVKKKGKSFQQIGSILREKNKCNLRGLYNRKGSDTDCL